MSDVKDLIQDHWYIVALVCVLLFLSLALNVFCCALRCCSGKAICQGRKRQRVRESQRQMEENPIYGNLGYVKTSQTFSTEVDPSPSTTQTRVIYDSKATAQDCYANLALKPPGSQSGRNSAQVMYSDVVHLETLPEPAREELKEQQGEEGEGEGGQEADSTDVMSTVSDLYASVQTQRSKTIDPAVDGEAYANHV